MSPLLKMLFPIVLLGLVSAGCQPPSEVCPQGTSIYGFPDQPAAWACISNHRPDSRLNAQPYCPKYALTMGYIGWYWESDLTSKYNYTCPTDMKYISSSPLDFNPLHQATLYDFCLHRVDVEWKELSGLWLYCYYWPGQTVGYGFTWSASTATAKLLEKPLSHGRATKI